MAHGLVRRTCNNLLSLIMTITNNIVAKLSVAFVAVAMAFTLAAPAQAQNVSNMSLEQLIALVNQLQAQLSGTGTATSCTTFTRALGQGSTGADVMALQKFLNSDSATIVAVSGAGSAGMETSFYGPATAAAVSKFQTKYSADILVPSGLTSPTGYFGPASMAKANALCKGGSTGGNTGGSTGALQGGAGSITVNSYTSDVEDEVATGDSENVLGFRIEADGSDVEVTNLKISLEYKGNGSNRLERYFDSFDVVMEGKTVATVDADDFTRDSAGKYSKTVALNGAIVREDDRNTFYVVAHARTTIDTADQNKNWDISATNFRYVDAQGAIISEGDVITNTGVYVIKLASSGEVKARISLSPSNPNQQAVKVSTTNSGDLVTLLEFRIKAEGTDMSFDQISFVIATSGVLLSDMASEFRFMKGSTVIETADNSDVVATTSSRGVLTFALDDEEYVDQDDTETYKLVARMNKNTFVGSSITASYNAVTIEDNNGDTVQTISGSAVGNAQTFRGDGLFAAIDSTTANLLSTTVNNSSRQYGEFKFVIDVTADGDDFYFASTSGVVDYDILTAAGAVDTAATASSTATLTSNATKTAGGDYVIYDGETKRVTYTVTMGIGASAGAYKAIANSFDFGDAANAVANQTAINLTPASDFTTGTVIIVQ